MEEEQLDREDSVPDLELTSTSSGFSSLLTNEDSRSTSSSGEVSMTSSSSGEIPVVIVTDAVIPLSIVELPPSGVAETLTVRQKCVGRNNKGVSWGFTSVIGRRREMEDAVAVIPGFMSLTCNHVGGCTAPGSRSSSDISPLHFFGVYDGHGGVQVIFNSISFILKVKLK